jgi:methyl-accepting chemotaxis protein
MATKEEPGAHPSRKPFRNFVFAPRVQWPQIVRNGMLVAFTSLGTGMAILLIYHREFGDASFYIMEQNSTMYPVDRSGLMGLLVPAVGGTAVTGMLLGWLLTLGASRRIALPVYKIGQWAQRVAQGDLHVRLGFRGGDGLEGLADNCNAALDSIRAGILEVEQLSEDEKIPEEVRNRLGAILSRYNL